MSAPVLCVVGTRPEAIKMAPVVRELRGRGVPASVCLTGQHPTLGAEALAAAGVDADVRCALDGPATPSRVREAVGEAIRAVRPTFVVVHGDTTSTLGGALAARALGVPIAHVEAGLRSHDLLAPFPEELHRVVVDRISRYHLAPTPLAREHLLTEGLAPAGITVTGNTGIDALHDVLAVLGPPPERERLVLVTAHRRENLGAPLRRIVSAVGRLAEAYPDHDFVVPVHPNPAAAEPLATLIRPNVHRLAPLPYPDFVRLLRRARLVLTDSGGVQEEAPVLGTPLLLLRQVTERPEGVEAGTARLVGSDPDRIVAETARLLEDASHHARMSRPHSPYGDGRAASRIAAVLERALATPALATR